ncbi:50S ribosomal protein L10 [bacterium]|jgi:large subunit ribosomal protein L10|nr:50S ribosomal protein L10 [bacterium]MBT4121653.1 50S ribosomal protein L10 [bacterium]MBT4335596.1 50S ribosomal protein L10 [bacterium]MBT4495470.1 50S ribosomal protein L10 [bacterium]MBT4764268.1 50S ribosomal protein L10 [bacterium]
MAKTRKQKEQEVKSLTDNLSNSKSVVFTSFKGLSVANAQELRKNLREEKVNYQASKKTFIKEALKQSKFAEIDMAEWEGNVAVAFGTEDEVAPAKILNNFSKDHEELQIHGGFLEQEQINVDKVKELALLPSRIELIAKTVGTIKAPISSFVNVLGGNIRNLVNVLNAVKDTKN